MRKRKIILLLISANLVFLMACSNRYTTIDTENTIVDEKNNNEDMSTVEETVLEAKKDPDSELVVADNADSSDNNNLDKQQLLSDESMAAYERFLHLEEELYFDNYAMDGLVAGQGYVFRDVIKAISENGGFEEHNYHDFQYAYIDCGNDGIPELLISFSDSTEMSEYEGDTDCAIVIKYIDGKLQFCTEEIWHYRNAGAINKYGISFGSMTAYAGCGMDTDCAGVDKDGKRCDLFYTDECYAEAIPSTYCGGDNGIDLSSMSDKWNEWGDKVYLYSTTFSFGQDDGKTIYSYEIFDSGIDSLTVEQILTEGGMPWIPKQEYDSEVKKYIEEFGLSVDEFYAGEPEFSPLEAFNEAAKNFNEEDTAKSDNTYNLILNDVVADSNLNSETARMFSAFLHGEITAENGGEQISIYELLAEDIRKYLNNQGGIEQQDDNSIEIPSDFGCFYCMMEHDGKSILYILNQCATTEGTLYQVFCEDDKVVFKTFMGLSWCDDVSIYESGILTVYHGQHSPACEFYMMAAEPLHDVWQPEVDGEKAKLLIVSPKEWVTDDDMVEYEEMADRVIVLDGLDANEWSDTEKSVLGDSWNQKPLLWNELITGTDIS
ncbi:hypothetical protein [Butyrivibrio sp. WCD2001]|uniref:hypothetical protein n=1 Tax=Butyrivibrio sp. WCD2001 TaxID=1280681 RepID=UPI00047E5137|nr:hypothetical protein [Butyrivibrio sp. WCD2001]